MDNTKLISKIGTVIAVFVINILNGGIVFNLSVYYDAFLEAFQKTRAETSWVSSILMFFFFGSCILGSLIVNRTSCRTAIAVGGFFTGIGLVASYFVNSLYELYITYGVITGIGLSVAWTGIIVYLEQYFDSNEVVIAIGFVATGASVGQFIYPYISLALIERYGWRGALLITGAISLNMCVIGGLLRPPCQVNHTEKNSKESEAQDEKHDQERTNFIYGSRNILNMKPVSTNHLHASISDRLALPTKRKNTFDSDIFKNVSFLTLIISTFLFLFGMSAIYIHLFPFALSGGYSQDDGAALMTMLGAGTAAGRVVLGIIASHKKSDPLLLYASCTTISGICITLFPFCPTLYGLYICIGLYGFFAAIFITLWPVIILIAVGTSKLASGIGACSFLGAVGIFCGGPTAGVIYDITRSYEVSFYIGGGVVILGGVIELLPWYLRRRKESTQKTMIMVKEVQTTVELDAFISRQKTAGKNTNILHV